MENNLYILQTISINEKTQKGLAKEWEMRNLEYPSNYISFEKFIEMLKGFGVGEDKYSYFSEDNCYFLSKEKAIQYAKMNIADLNDGGTFNYIAIIEVPFDQAYAQTSILDIMIFEYLPSKEQYQKISLYKNEETKLIAKKNNCNHFFPSK